MNQVTYRIEVCRRFLSILCLICGYRSFNKHDIAEKYCGMCKRFHDEQVIPEKG